MRSTRIASTLRCLKVIDDYEMEFPNQYKLFRISIDHVHAM